MGNSEREIETPFNRSHHSSPIRADYYEGDKVSDGLMVQEAHSAVLGINHKSDSKGILAGSMDKNPDVGVGGKSEVIGVFGTSERGIGVFGSGKTGIGVWCESETNEALHAETKSTETAAIAAYNTNPESNTAALFSKKSGSKGFAAFLDGNVRIVTGDLTVANNLNIENGKLLMHGESIWDFISELQQKVILLSGGDVAIEQRLAQLELRVIALESRPVPR